MLLFFFCNSHEVCGFVTNPSDRNDGICYTSKIITALHDSGINAELAANDRRGLLNLSLGDGKGFFSYFYGYYFGLIRSNGGIAVVAAGNSYDDSCCYSGAFSDKAITVGASGEECSVEFQSLQCLTILMHQCVVLFFVFFFSFSCFSVSGYFSSFFWELFSFFVLTTSVHLKNLLLLLFFFVDFFWHY